MFCFRSIPSVWGGGEDWVPKDVAGFNCGVDDDGGDGDDGGDDGGDGDCGGLNIISKELAAITESKEREDTEMEQELAEVWSLSMIDYHREKKMQKMMILMFFF